jgi:hypothetical protein
MRSSTPATNTRKTTITGAEEVVTTSRTAEKTTAEMIEEAERGTTMAEMKTITKEADLITIRTKTKEIRDHTTTMEGIGMLTIGTIGTSTEGIEITIGTETKPEFTPN